MRKSVKGFCLLPARRLSECDSGTSSSASPWNLDEVQTLEPLPEPAREKGWGWGPAAVSQSVLAVALMYAVARGGRGDRIIPSATKATVSVGVTLGGARSVGSDKSIMACSHHASIRGVSLP